MRVGYFDQRRALADLGGTHICELPLPKRSTMTPRDALPRESVPDIAGTPLVHLGFTQGELDAMDEVSGNHRISWLHDLVTAALDEQPRLTYEISQELCDEHDVDRAALVTRVEDAESALDAITRNLIKVGALVPVPNDFGFPVYRQRFISEVEVT